MPESYSSKHIIGILKSEGFRLKSQRGSHQKFIKDTLIVIVPHPKKEIPPGTFQSILKQANLTKDIFKR